MWIDNKEEFQSLHPDRSCLLGQTFSRWTVRAFIGIDSYRDSLWCCQCSCGEVGAVRLSSLTSGVSKGCVKCRRQPRSSPRWMELTPEDIQEIRERHEDGQDSRSIARTFQITAVRVLKLLNS